MPEPKPVLRSRRSAWRTGASTWRRCRRRRRRWPSCRSTSTCHSSSTASRRRAPLCSRCSGQGAFAAQCDNDAPAGLVEPGALLRALTGQCIQQMKTLHVAACDSPKSAACFSLQPVLVTDAQYAPPASRLISTNPCRTCSTPCIVNKLRLHCACAGMWACTT